MQTNLDWPSPSKASVTDSPAGDDSVDDMFNELNHSQSGMTMTGKVVQTNNKSDQNSNADSAALEHKQELDNMERGATKVDGTAVVTKAATSTDAPNPDSPHHSASANHQYNLDPNDDFGFESMTAEKSLDSNDDEEDIPESSDEENPDVGEYTQDGFVVDEEEAAEEEALATIEDEIQEKTKTSDGEEEDSSDDDNFTEESDSDYSEYESDGEYASDDDDDDEDADGEKKSNATESGMEPSRRLPSRNARNSANQVIESSVKFMKNLRKSNPGVAPIDVIRKREFSTKNMHNDGDEDEIEMRETNEYQDTVSKKKKQIADEKIQRRMNFARKLVVAEQQYFIERAFPRSRDDMRAMLQKGSLLPVGHGHDFVSRMREMTKYNVDDPGINLPLFVMYFIRGMMTPLLGKNAAAVRRGASYSETSWEQFTQDNFMMFVHNVKLMMCAANISYHLVKPKVDAWMDAAFDAMASTPVEPEVAHLAPTLMTLRLVRRVLKSSQNFSAGTTQLLRAKDLNMTSKTTGQMHCPISGNEVQTMGKSRDMWVVFGFEDKPPSFDVVVEQLQRRHFAVFLTQSTSQKTIGTHMLMLLVSSDATKHPLWFGKRRASALNLVEAVLGIHYGYYRLMRVGDGAFQKPRDIDVDFLPRIINDLYEPATRKSELLLRCGDMLRGLAVLSEISGVKIDVSHRLTPTSGESSADCPAQDPSDGGTGQEC